MCNKYSKTIIEILEQNRVYIVKYIVKNLNKFVLIFTVYILHLETAFSAVTSDISLNNNIIDFSEINTASLNKKI